MTKKEFDYIVASLFPKVERVDIHLNDRIIAKIYSREDKTLLFSATIDKFPQNSRYKVTLF